jgi:signal transduction histidine kinase
MIRLGPALVAGVAALPMRVQNKLLIAFLAIVMLLIGLGAVALYTLSAINQRNEELIRSERKIAAYRQVQHDTISQLYTVSSALLISDDRSLDSVLRQLNQFGYDLERLQFVAKDELQLLDAVRQEYERFIAVVTRVVELIRGGHVAEAREAQLNEARPLAGRLERLTDELVNRAEADIVSVIEESGNDYHSSRTIVVVFALGAITLALVLGRSISWSIVGPIREIEATLSEIAAGDFTRRVKVANHDELGALGANVNRMSEQLGNLYRQLETASAHKSAFLASMSHELRTPLNAIIGFTELLVDGIYGELPPRPLGVLERVQENGRNLLALINDVLDLAKIEAGQLDFHFETYHIGTVAESVVETMRPLAATKQLSLDFILNTDMVQGYGDPMRLRQVLINLVGNAIKFTDDGSVVLDVMSHGDRFRIDVRDTGPGIAPEDRDRIFDKFQQGESLSTRQKGGTGLGLAISREIVLMHGGSLSLISQPGCGSTFRIEVPIRASEDELWAA